MLYDQIDVECSDDGDLVLENGDLKMATVARTIVQSLNFVALTNFGEYLPAPVNGGNLGRFIGKINTSTTRSLMTSQLYFGIEQQGFMAAQDVGVTISAIADDEVVIILQTQPIILEPDPDDVIPEPIVIGYIYPYISGTLETIDLDETLAND